MRDYIVDAHTAHHLYHECLKGDLMRGRTIVLVSHHVQLCAPGAQYIVALDNGQVRYTGDYEHFIGSDTYKTLVHTDGHLGHAETKENATEESVEKTVDETGIDETGEEAIAPGKKDAATTEAEKKQPRKLVEDEGRATGRVDRAVWRAYLAACGDAGYWVAFFLTVGLSGISPVLESGWLK